ncbi:blast:Putative 115 kDa protein in type-1 retrotransposable element R1DM, partial [Drosophila guanche]
PICLLDTIGKVFEKVIATRLSAAIEAAGGLSPEQYGFRKGKSTLDAISKVVKTAEEACAGSRWRGGSKSYCLVVTLDIRNAFNSADWSRTLEALQRFNIPGYLQRIAPNTSMVGFADDVAIVVVAKHLAAAEELANAAVRAVESWLTVAGLDLAAQKTEAVLISSRKAVETASVQVGGTTIRSQRAIKYLGVLIDTRLSFKEHLEYVQRKASGTAGALSRMLLNTRGPKQATRKLLTSVVTSQILYAAPAWAKAAQVKTYMRGVEATYRLCALRIACSFRTVSDEAALVIAGQVPLRELIRERAEIHTAVPGRHPRGHGGRGAAGRQRPEPQEGTGAGRDSQPSDEAGTSADPKRGHGSVQQMPTRGYVPIEVEEATAPFAVQAGQAAG